MLIAVEGCSHGELDKIYETLEYISKEHGKKVDLLLCCGDFQAVRNVYDLSCMAVPPKFLAMQNFHKYYSGEKEAPVLTIFIGGNHEASNYLQELSLSGWVAPNIFYLGNAGVVEVNGIRIAGLSGIYKGHDYLKGHFECPPYNEDTKRSVYHVRQLEVFRLKQISRPIDIFMSHDWPVGITDHGDKDGLLRFKPFLREDMDKGVLGNPSTWDLLQKLRPKYWFSGHLHAKFAATVKHGEENGETKFLALDKCLPHKRFLQILDIPIPSAEETAVAPQISFDAEWLGILKATDHLWNFESAVHYMPGAGGSEKYDFTQTDEDLAQIREVFAGNLKMNPDSFQRTAPIHEPSLGDGPLYPILKQMEEKNLPVPPNKAHVNPQTTWLCDKMSIRDPLVEAMTIAELKKIKKEEETKTTMEVIANTEEIDLNGGGNETEKETNGTSENVSETKDLFVTDVTPMTEEDGVNEPASKKLKADEDADAIAQQ